VTEQFGTHFPQFYLTVPAPCPYLKGHLERKVFTQLQGGLAIPLNDALTHAGFRRSQNIAYKPACEGCDACISVRIVVDEFRSSRSFRRIKKQNLELEARVIPPVITEEQFSILRGYLDERHTGGGMSDMTVLDYATMVEDSAVNTFLIEYRQSPACAQGGQPLAFEEKELVAVALTDRLGDGLSMVYSFYDTGLADRSLGTYMVLDHVARSRQEDLSYVYLGYWVAGCSKMDYKTRFKPIEALGAQGWAPLDK